MQPGVDAASERELGGTFFIDRPTPQRLANWRSKAQSAAAREAGFAYSAYGHQKLSGILDELANALLLGAGEDVRPNMERVRTILWLWRSEEHTSELQSLMRIAYAVFCLTNKRRKKQR